MSNKTLVIYLKDENLKQELAKEAARSHISLSSMVNDILRESLANKKKRPPKPKNSLLQFAGVLTEEEADKIEESIKEFRENTSIDFR